MAGLAFFDVDKTLLSVNSAGLWVRRERALGHLTVGQVARATLWGALYTLGLMRADDAIRVAVRALRGRNEREVIARTLAFWNEHLAHLIRPGARLAVQRHRDAGDLCFLLTSTSNYLSMPIADVLQLDGFLANRFVVEDGVFTGDPIEPVCFGAGKLAHARECSAKVGVPLTDASFYTDSLSDLPVLLEVGRPVAVNPDVRLRREARRRGWPIEDWGVPTPSAPRLPAPR